MLVKSLNSTETLFRVSVSKEKTFPSSMMGYITEDYFAEAKPFKVPFA